MRKLPPVSKPYHLYVWFSNKNVSSQIVRKADGYTIVAASTAERAVREGLEKTADVRAAGRVGEVLAQRATAAEIPAVHWIRKRGQRFHGKVKEFITSMRAAGLPLN
ncbi:hypothetical protein WJX81_002492 [Elliptochloris bilobata]|uniref:50S ribosomal protein L18 n=1 Tax=Elliptochloris bilobata TaxID=381761 RepID=A0AAW1R1K8_9CHLO